MLKRYSIGLKFIIMEENLNQNQEVKNEAMQPIPEMSAQEQASQQPESQPHQPYQQPRKLPVQTPPFPPQHLKRNMLGGTGFILGVIGIVLFWAPFVRFILGVLGLTFSLVGLFRKDYRKAFAITGVILSTLVLLIVAVIWAHFGYTLTDIFNDDFMDFLNFLDK